jgi:hypothetical protein
MGNQITYSNKTTNNAVVLRILIFVFLDGEREDQRFSTER